jgi:hypothetical protein
LGNCDYTWYGGSIRACLLAVEYDPSPVIACAMSLTLSCPRFAMKLLLGVSIVLLMLTGCEDMKMDKKVGKADYSNRIQL